MLKEFKKFALRGNVIDMAVGIVVGGAFTAIVKALVDHVIMPPLGVLLGGADFGELYILLKSGDPGGPYGSLADAQAAGAATLNYGLFINAVVGFLLVALAMFFLIRGINALQHPAEKPAPAPTKEKDCPYCYTSIPIQATRCPHCTSELPSAER